MRLPAPLPTLTLALLIGALLALACQPANAQWKWRDESGRIHYSDQPPPKSVPPSQIRELGLASDPTVVGTPASGGAAETGKAKSWAERALELRRRDAEREAARNKEEARERELAARTQLCDGLRGEERTLQSGVRIASVNRQGEPIVIDDEERAARLEAIQRDIKTHCPIS